ncbi:MAG: hypothetical protein M3Q69_18150, partial [Acidobacteriota bacterium]|nr:hypothetical protein [Acidobacteriota bacterium]
MSRSILVVEDYPDLRSAIAELLSRNDCVCEAVDSDGAIAKLESAHYERILIGPRLSIAGDPVLDYLAEHQPAQMEHVVLMLNPAADEDSTDST